MTPLAMISNLPDKRTVLNRKVEGGVQATVMAARRRAPDEIVEFGIVVAVLGGDRNPATHICEWLTGDAGTGDSIGRHTCGTWHPWTKVKFAGDLS